MIFELINTGYDRLACVPALGFNVCKYGIGPDGETICVDC